MLGCHYFPLSKCVKCMQCGWSTVCQNVKHVVGQYRACVVDLLGLEIHMSGVYYCFICLSPFCASPIFHFPNLMNFYIYVSPLFLCSIIIIEGILSCTLCHAGIKQRINILYIYTCIIHSMCVPVTSSLFCVVV